MFKHGHAPIGKCKVCKSNVYIKNGKQVCPRCGEVNFNSIEVKLDTKVNYE
jgi:uncharacterized Zn finger protein (UPF0148 family)